VYHLPSFDGATGWLNSSPVGAAELEGKVVLVDFWTYTCINWLRTLGYVRAWAEKYADRGLVVVGVHTPEFPFERDAGNVSWAVEQMRVEYPVALDPDYAVWDAFANRYWPALYVADPEGNIEHHQFGEGGYEECERVLQQMLPADDGLVAPALEGFEAQADWANLESPESYLGSEQARNFAREARPNSLKLNQWTLIGDWSMESRACVLNEPDGRIVFRFHARDVHLVMGPRPRDHPFPFACSSTGEPPGDAHGLDVDEEGRGTLSHQRLYQLIRQPGSIADRTFDITFLAPGAEAYCFTFG
jgi:hypothetical protein